MNLIDIYRVYLTFSPDRTSARAIKPYVGDHHLMYTEFAFYLAEPRHTSPMKLPVTNLEKEGYT